MDSNHTRFHLLLGHVDWARALLADGKTPLGDVWSAAESPEASPAAEELVSRAGWLDANTQELTLRPRLPRFTASAGDRPVELAQRRGAARDRYGNWYYVAPERGEILVRSSGSDIVTPFWPLPEPNVHLTRVASGDFEPREPEPEREAPAFTSLAVTRDHHLVAPVVAGGRTEILVFDLFAGGPPLRFAWPAAVPLSAWDLAAREPGGFWLLDREARRLWEFDTYFQVMGPRSLGPADPAPEDFSGVEADGVTPRPPRGAEPGSPRCAVTRVTLEYAVPLVEVDPIAVEPLPGGGALVLDGAGSESRVGAYRDFTHRGSASLEELLSVIDFDDLETFRLVPHDMAVVTEPAKDLALGAEVRAPLLFVADRQGNQAFCFELRVSESGRPAVKATTEFLPMRRFEGRALVSADGRAYYDGFRRFVPLVAQDRPRFEESAVVLTAPLDGDAPGCVWHRVLFEGCIPSDTSIQIASRATDADGAELSGPEGREAVLAALARLPWDVEPEPVRRASGNELPWLRAEAAGPHDTWELLMQRAKGRYTQLRIILAGDGRRSPRVRALRVYYPRFSYLQNYLPACYRDDVQSASLVERLLANHEGLVTAVEDRALSLGTLFDPAATPAEFLDWLGLWYAAYLDPAWPPLRKRLFLRHAMTFFQWRGTSRGLRAALRLAFDDCIDDALFTEAGDRDAEAQRYRVTEDFRVRSLPTEVPPPTSDCPGVCDRAAEPLFQASEGREALDRRWRLATSAATGEYPLSSPAGSEAAWSAFSLATLGFVPRSSAADAAAWGRFLRCRHRTFDEARGAWSSVFDAEWDSFHDVTLPTALPDSESALADWLVFNRVVLPMRASAHRFTVSLPVSPSRARDAELLRVQLHLADRLVMLEKPSQTAYRVQLYWALFRVGEARLGSDTELGQGSRLPELLPPLVLGEGALAEGRLAPRPEDRNRGRFELGRNPLRAGPRNRRNDPSGDFETS